MDYAYKGSTSITDFAGFVCPACKYELFSKPEDKKSKVTIAGMNAGDTHGSYIGPTKKIEPDEVKSQDKKPFWSKPGSPRPTKYFCITCNKERSTVGKKCPICHNEIATE